MADSEVIQAPKGVKKRRIGEKDFERLKVFVFSELERRKGSKFRKMHEQIWREVDRQIAMQPPAAVNKSGRPDEDWHAAVQLGLLSDAAEILTKNVMRLAMPTEAWFTPHIEIEWGLDSEGRADVDPRRQRSADVSLRSFMIQQHKDFGLRDRVTLAVNESYRHGSFVAEVRMQRQARYHDGTAVETLSAPTWVLHSMWNCYPDPSPSIVGTDLFYTGSMIIEGWMKREDAERMPDWKNVSKIPRSSGRNNSEDVGKDDLHVVRYYGNVTLDRRDGSIFLPNRNIIFANEQLVFTEINSTPYSPIIYMGHERADIRDPYYTSPVVKRAPMAKGATQMFNKLLDSVELKVEPPTVWDKHDTALASQGGPVIAPGAQTPSSGAANVKQLETGDPSWAQAATMMMIGEVEKGTSVDATRAGISDNTERTATEVVKKDQKSEVRDVDFVGTLERQGLRPFLYMQHDMNRARLEDYPFFNSDLGSPDFQRANRKNLPGAVHFEITGSRALLGEEQRVLRFREAAAFHASNEFLAAKTDWDEVSREVWEGSGSKDPERFIVSADGDDEGDQVRLAVEQAVQQVTQQAQQAIGQLQEQAGKLTEENAKLNTEIQQQDIKLSGKDAELKAKELEKTALQETARIEKAKDAAEDELERIEGRVTKAAADVTKSKAEESGQMALALRETQSAVQQVSDDIADAEKKRAEREAEVKPFVETVLSEIEARSPETGAKLRASLPKSEEG